MSERPPDQPGGDEPPPSDVPDEVEGLEGYEPHHREEFKGWIKKHDPRGKGDETDEPKPTVDENS